MQFLIQQPQLLRDLPLVSGSFHSRQGRDTVREFEDFQPLAVSPYLLDQTCPATFGAFFHDRVSEDEA
jgi:hypothetical protein